MIKNNEIVTKRAMGKTDRSSDALQTPSRPPPDPPPGKADRSPEGVTRGSRGGHEGVVRPIRCHDVILLGQSLYGPHYRLLRAYLSI
eukprot:7779754-Pyramimonas_sp.AAC.1